MKETSVRLGTHHLKHDENYTESQGLIKRLQDEFEDRTKTNTTANGSYLRFLSVSSMPRIVPLLAAVQRSRTLCHQ